jgi:fused signal recognition particle receptor
MILWWGKKKPADPKTGERPIEPLPPGEDARPRLSLDEQLFGPVSEREPEPPSVDEGDDPIGLRRAYEKIQRERAEEQARREASVAFKLQEGLKRSSSRIADGIASAFTHGRLDRKTLEDLEEVLITSDMGSRAAARLSAALAKDRFDREVTADEIKQALAEGVQEILQPREVHVDFSVGPSPRIVLFVGVNGSGKTTTIGKIAWKLSQQGADVTLAAGDTFRAAAVEQLKVWADRAGARFVSKPAGSDAAALAWEAVDIAKKENRDLVLIDTAGRLQNKAQLMDELAKVVRAIRKQDPTAPHDVILVLDATVGQNALSQVEAFREIAGVTGLVMTKLDGTAKGGVLVAIAEKFDLPIHFVGVGEQAEDLQPFSARIFSRALVGLT